MVTLGFHPVIGTFYPRNAPPVGGFGVACAGSVQTGTETTSVCRQPTSLTTAHRDCLRYLRIKILLLTYLLTYISGLLTYISGMKGFLLLSLPYVCNLLRFSVILCYHRSIYLMSFFHICIMFNKAII